MSVAPRIKAAFALAALTVLGYVAIGELTPTADREIVTDHGTYPTHLRIGEAPAGASGELVEVVAPSPSWTTLGMDPSGWGAVARICAAIPDGGADESFSALLAAQGIIALPGEVLVDCPPGSPALEIWDARDPEAPLRCACGPRDPDPASPCITEGRPARVGEYLTPDSYSGDCPLRMCRESNAAGQPAAGYSMPERCRAQ